MRNLIFSLAGVALLAACTSNRQAKNYNNLIDDSSVTFIKQGLESGQTTLRASKLAETNSTNPRVIYFAKMVIADHMISEDRLEKIAVSNRVSGADSVSAEHQQLLKNLTALKGKAFDKAYMDVMVTEHQDALKLYNKATTDRLDDVQRLAKINIYKLRTHLDSANNIAIALK